MPLRAGEHGRGIAAVAEEQSASTEEVSASAEEMAAQIEETSAQAQQLAGAARQLQQLTSRFHLAGELATPDDTDTHGRVVRLPLAA